MDDDMPKLGATGRFPLGKLDPNDEGELCAALTVDPVTGIATMDFGKSVRWLAMTAEEAETWAQGLLDAARHLREGRI